MVLNVFSKSSRILKKISTGFEYINKNMKIRRDDTRMPQMEWVYLMLLLCSFGIEFCLALFLI